MDIQNNQFSSEQYFIANPFWAKANFLSDEKLAEYLNFINSMPENVKNLMYSAEAADIISLIGQKNNLSDSQINSLAIEAGNIITGQSPLNKFVPALSKILKSNIEIARMVAQEINIKIFSKASLQIKKLQEKNFPEFAPKPQQQTPAQPARSVMQSEYYPTVRKPEDRVVNLRQEVPAPQPKKPVMIDPGPRIEGNVVDLSN